MSLSSGARQWRHDCECSAHDSKVMHSQVSSANADYFIDEDRLRDDDLDAADLREKVRETTGSIIVCNVCGRQKTVDEDDVDNNQPGVDAW